MNYLSKNILSWRIYGLVVITLFILFLANCKQEKVVEKVPVPEVTNISPLEGTVGDIVLVEGKNFGWEPIVTTTINDSVAVVKRVSDTEIELIVPKNAEDEGDIVLIIGETKIVWGEKFKHIIVVLTGPQVNTYAGNTTGYKDSSALQAKFKFPQGVAVDAVGNVYVVATDNNARRKISANGAVTTIVMGGSAGFNDGQGSIAQFNYPIGIAIGSSGSLFIADNRNNGIRKIMPNGFVTALVGNGDAESVDGSVKSSKGLRVAGVDVDALGNVDFMECDSHKVPKISANGMISTIAGNGVAGYTDDTGAKAQFNNPYGIVVYPTGQTLYLMDRNNSKVRYMALNGVVPTLAGSDPDNENGTGTVAKFNSPAAICLDHERNFLVDENHGLRKVTLDGVVSTIAEELFRI